MRRCYMQMNDLRTNSEIELNEQNRELRKRKRIDANITEPLMRCDELFLNTRVLLQIFATIPVSTATAERSFSSSRRLKNYTISTNVRRRIKWFSST